jgi:hypothetical protein
VIVDLKTVEKLTSSYVDEALNCLKAGNLKIHVYPCPEPVRVHPGIKVVTQSTHVAALPPHVAAQSPDRATTASGCCSTSADRNCNFEGCLYNHVHPC